MRLRNYCIINMKNKNHTTDNYVNSSYRLSPAADKAITALSKEMGCTRGQLVEKLINNFHKFKIADSAAIDSNK